MSDDNVRYSVMLKRYLATDRILSDALVAAEATVKVAPLAREALTMGMMCLGREGRLPQEVADSVPGLSELCRDETGPSHPVPWLRGKAAEAVAPALRNAAWTRSGKHPVQMHLSMAFARDDAVLRACAHPPPQGAGSQDLPKRAMLRGLEALAEADALPPVVLAAVPHLAAIREAAIAGKAPPSPVPPKPAALAEEGEGLSVPLTGDAGRLTPSTTPPTGETDRSAPCLPSGAVGMDDPVGVRPSGDRFTEALATDHATPASLEHLKPDAEFSDTSTANAGFGTRPGMATSPASLKADRPDTFLDMPPPARRARHAGDDGMSETRAGIAGSVPGDGNETWNGLPPPASREPGPDALPASLPTLPSTGKVPAAGDYLSSFLAQLAEEDTAPDVPDAPGVSPPSSEGRRPGALDTPRPPFAGPAAQNWSDKRFQVGRGSTATPPVPSAGDHLSGFLSAMAEEGGTEPEGSETPPTPPHLGDRDAILATLTDPDVGKVPATGRRGSGKVARRGARSPKEGVQPSDRAAPMTSQPKSMVDAGAARPVPASFADIPPARVLAPLPWPAIPPLDWPAQPNL